MTLKIVLATVLALNCTIASAQADDNPPPTSTNPTAPSSSASETATSAMPGLRFDTEALPVLELPKIPQLPNTIDLTSDPSDLFERLRNGFSMPNINTDLVLHHQQWFMTHPGHLRRVVERSSLYLYHIVEELNKRGMPTELALLPMVESAYNPMAYSPARASGLWQFIPSTGKNYKLQQDWWVDERRDIVASTTAALDYLETIYELHGDWHLALASYNWGEGSVGRAIAKNRAKGLPTDYLSLKMPAETKNYVPKLQALKNIFGNPQLLVEMGLQAVPNRAYFGTVARPTNIDVTVAAKLAEMPVGEFVALNPAHNRPVIKSDTPLVIPADKIDNFISNLENHQDNDKPLSNWQAYTFRAGDKLEKIAPRFGMTVANLKAVNGIQGRLKVTPGFTLLVAGHNATAALDMAPLAEQPRLPSADPVRRTSGKSKSAGKTTKKTSGRQTSAKSAQPVKTAQTGKPAKKPKKQAH